MTTLRFLLILLLLLNALAFAAIKGWLGFVPPRGEPERISNQLHPDRFRFLGDSTVPGAPLTPKPSTTVEAVAEIKPAPATETVTEPILQESAEEPAEEPAPQPQATVAPTPEAACFAWSGLNAAEAAHLAALLSAGGITPGQSTVDVPTSWWVRIPPLQNREAAERRARELRAQGVSDLFIVQEAGPNQFAISLGLFKTEAPSRQHLAQLAAKGVRGAGVASRTTTEYRIEVTADSAALAATLADDDLAKRQVRCPQ